MTTALKKRPRRIASDEAHAWARNLRLQNTNAKFLLMVLAGYVDGDGVCFVSTTALAEDTELSQQTIRSRLGWLEEIGVIARTPQWIDEFGHRTSNGKGRRTSDNIRLMIDLDADSIEARATGGNGPENPEAKEFDPQNVTLSQPNVVTVAPPAAPMPDPPVDPQATAEGLISEPEPEPESLPKPLSEGLDASENAPLKEVEHFPEFWRAYPGHEVMSRYRAMEVFDTMTIPERIHARAAALIHAETLTKMKRRPKDAHKWLAEKGWQEYPQAKLPAASVGAAKRLIRGKELAAVAIGLKIAGRPLPSIITTTSEETGRACDSTFWSRDVGADLMALATFDLTDLKNTHQVTEGSREYWAWREKLQAWFGGEIFGERIWLEPYDPEVHGLPGSDPNYKIRRFTKGFCVPTPWPPSVEGKLYPTTGPPEPELSEAEMADFK